jgi:hypothetical protein
VRPFRGRTRSARSAVCFRLAIAAFAELRHAVSASRLASLIERLSSRPAWSVRATPALCAPRCTVPSCGEIALRQISAHRLDDRRVDSHGSCAEARLSLRLDDHIPRHLLHHFAIRPTRQTCEPSTRAARVRRVRSDRAPSVKRVCGLPHERLVSPVGARLDDRQPHIHIDRDRQAMPKAAVITGRPQSRAKRLSPTLGPSTSVPGPHRQ